MVQIVSKNAARRAKQRRPGFSLIELLVVIGIMGILLSLLLAAVQKVRAAAAMTECANHLKQIGLALQAYHDTHKVLPPGCSYENGASPQPFLSWQTRLLPFLENKALWETTLAAFKENSRFLHNPPHVGFATVVPVFTCPSDGRTLDAHFLGADRPVAFTAYLGVEGTNQFRKDGVLFLDSKIRFVDILDGQSNTLMAGERPPSADGFMGWLYAGEGQDKDGSGDMVLGTRELNATTYGPGCPGGPFRFQAGSVKNQCDAFHFWSLHTGGAHFLFCDGSVRFLTYSADNVLPALGTRRGGETPELPF